MSLEIIEDKKNPLLKRREILFRIKTKTPPKKEEVPNLLQVDPSLTAVKNIKCEFGKNEFIGEVFVYDNLEAKEKIETIPRKVRKKMKEELAKGGK
ncbi:MAG: hypothetical protein QW273_01320 [Candidatus Pacearchaeota archaeon]